MDSDIKEELAELKAESKMDRLRIQALLNLLAKEGLVRKDEFEEELESLCEKRD